MWSEKQLLTNHRSVNTIQTQLETQFIVFAQHKLKKY